MFAGCTSLQIVELPATTLADFCYGFMFQDCSALQSVRIQAKPSLPDEPSLPDDIECFMSWLDGAGDYWAKIYCYQEFYDFVKGASDYGDPLCPGWSFYDIDNTWSQWGQY